MPNNHHLMFHLTWQELEKFPSGIMIPNDGLVFTHHGISPQIEKLLDKYRANTATIYRYLQCFTFPLSYPEDVDKPEHGWIGGGNWWFEFLHKLRTRHQCYYARPDGTPLRYKFGNRVIINWPKIEKVMGGIEKVRDYILGSIHPKDRVLLDDFFPRIEPWMFQDPGDYNTAVAQSDQGASLLLLRNYLQELRVTLTNGIDSWSPPHYLEHSEWNWEHDLKLWKENSESVLSVDPSQVYWVDRAIQEWDTRGGWLGFAGAGDTPETRDRAYQLANEARGVEWSVKVENEPS